MTNDNQDALRCKFDAWWKEQWPTLHKHANEKRADAWYAWKAASSALVAENEAKDALLRQAVEALEYHVQQTRPIQSTTWAIAAIRQHLEGRA